MPSVTVPEARPHFPVLYQVVSRGPGQGLTLEAKDFFIMGLDRMELHLIKLDQFATNVVKNTRGFDRTLVSVKDFVWVYSVEPTLAALRDHATVLRQARTTKATVLDNATAFFFRVKEFAFVTPPQSSRRVYGVTLSLTRHHNSTKAIRIAFEMRQRLSRSRLPSAISLSTTPEKTSCDSARPPERVDSDSVFREASVEGSSGATLLVDPFVRPRTPAGGTPPVEGLQAHSRRTGMA
ncbi:unnamed protein product [Heligmosomoides polygyrus]|uniref:Gag protein n=1 Tax=Heligmosomoides polygyrus TaxID=6339 RepID=A0A183G447_HELPZ|nr:unnamed protein product [Heligmosomoides polygyrus]